MLQPIFSLSNVTVNRNGNTNLNIKNFDIHRGAAYIISGKMASGKSTFINVIAKIIQPTNGTVQYEEKLINAYKNTEFSDQFAFVTQITKVPWGNVETYMKKTLKKYSHINNINENIKDIKRKMGLTELMSMKMSLLTPGQFRWVQLAANIAADTKVLIIDELELHLGKTELNNLIKLLYKKCNYDGVTLIATTQNKDLFLSRLASVSISLENGRIVSVRSSSKKGNNKRKY